MLIFRERWKLVDKENFVSTYDGVILGEFVYVIIYKPKLLQAVWLRGVR